MPMPRKSAATALPMFGRCSSLVIAARAGLATDLPALAIAHQSNGNAFDGEGCRASVDQNRCEVGVLRKQRDRMALAPQALDGDLVVDTRHHDLALTRLTRLV